MGTLHLTVNVRFLIQGSTYGPVAYSAGLLPLFLTLAPRDYITYCQAHGLAVGGTTPDTHGRPHGLRPQGWPSLQDEALRGTTLLGASRKTLGRYPEDTTRSVRIRSIP